MSRKAKASAIQLILRGILVKSSQKSCSFPPSLAISCSNFHNFGHDNRPFSPKPPIDFSCINRLDDALCLFQEIVRMLPQPSVRVFNGLLTVIAKMKHYSIVLNLFGEMRQRGAPVNEFTMNIFIDCCSLSNRVAFGFAILGSFYKRGYDPDATTFTTLIKGLFLDHKVPEAKKLFKNILILKFCEPSDVMILTVTNGLCKAGLAATARELLGRLAGTRWKPDVKAYNSVIDMLCKTGVLEDGWKFFNDMEAPQVVPDLNTYSILLDHLCTMRGTGEAFSLLHIMKKKGFTPDIIT